MDRRQRYALTRPLDRADGSLAEYRRTRTHGSGLLITTILAVDR